MFNLPTPNVSTGTSIKDFAIKYGDQIYDIYGTMDAATNLFGLNSPTISVVKPVLDDYIRTFIDPGSA